MLCRTVSRGFIFAEQLTSLIISVKGFVSVGPSAERRLQPPPAAEDDREIRRCSLQPCLCSCSVRNAKRDPSGRIRRGPAPLNLAVPGYAFTADTKIRIG